jgi:Undecaprenyl-phosphate galactose phosphotransferase WbaP
MAASLFRNTLLWTTAPPHLRTLLATLVLVLCSFMATGLYPGVTMNPIEELRRSTLSVTVAFLGLWAATFLLHDLSQSRLTYVLACVLTTLLVPLFRTGARSLFSTCSWWGSPVAILGFGTTGKRLVDTLTKNPRIGLKPVAVLDDNPEQYIGADSGLLRGPLSRCREISRDQRISYGIICMPSLSREELLQRIDMYRPCFGHMLVIPNLIGMTSLGISAKEVGGIVGLEVKQELLRPSSQLVKRILDLLITIVASPVVIFLVSVFAILSRIEGKGPTFYAHERIGHSGKKFRAWKLRSMVIDADEVLRDCLEKDPDLRAEWQASQKLKCDPRLTRVGRIARKTSIDELPQFWNVLIGEMSVVGPRPMHETQVSLYGPSVALYTQVRPGITGLWQVSGRNHLSFAERVKLDRFLIQNWSVWLDLYILARTAAVVLTAHGAY